MQEIKPQIKYEDFSKIDIRVGKIEKVEDIPGSEKLLKLFVDFGNLGKRQILSGIKKDYSPKDLEGLQALFVLNLEPKKMMGLESQGMILAVCSELDERAVLVVPMQEVSLGLGVC
ncbi:methionine--tRNA ligase subunit beta [Patescibacteria group bacterium]|nr:methionine--tRNA ligase subunit beta [Patescibacteria group bacterium]